MPRHEHFEELAALAARGELNASEVQELSLHLADCGECRAVHEEFVELHAPLGDSIDAELEAVIESRREKLKAAVLRATAATIAPPALPVVSGDILQKGRGFLGPFRLRWIGLPAAAACALALAFGLGMQYERRSSSGVRPDPVTNAIPELTTSALNTASQEPQKQLTENEYQKLANDLRSQEQRSAKLDAALTEKNRRLTESENVRTVLQQRLDAQLNETRRTETLLVAKTEELKQKEASKENDSNALVALRYQVEDLTGKLKEQRDSLDRERQLLASGREIRDIIGAKNLHIIDVYDTSAEGRTSKSFARAFYTEGKSLIFYAYDLPARRTEEGKFVYAAWGEKNGNKKTVRNLGILVNDDKGQKRWVLNFSDPKVLAEIDSVFVTLERVGADGEQPNGRRMLTAYLDSQVNHP
ncbi:MAG TPA: hypothetical protein VFI45_02760 [Candidatus Acidoferrum sp.]|nr:hypothetical protein [Candidatus Acidoferrum sp.]